MTAFRRLADVGLADAPEVGGKAASLGALLAEGDGLKHDVASGGGFGRPGEDGNASGVGGELIEEIVVAAAADDVEQLDFL